MSELQVGQINSTDGSTAITTGADGYVSFAKTQIGGRRNLIINGAMQVAQRGTQVTGVTSTGFRTVDRFQFRNDTLGTWTIDQSNDAPNGLSNSFKATCTTADASPASAGLCQFFYKVEAQDLQGLAYGTSDAKAITLSFWVKSNKTGNATVTFMQTDNSFKLASPQYTINSADTWEQKTITIAGDTSGVINNDNGDGLQIEFWMNSGSNYSSGSNQSAWSTYAETNRNPSNLGVGGTTSDYFAITGVQLEVGTVATPFEHRSYGEELALCQRYYQTVSSVIAYGASSTGIQANIPFMTQMRSEPSVTLNGGTIRLTDSASNKDSSTNPNSTFGDLDGAAINMGGFSGMTQHRPYIMQGSGGYGSFHLEAEL